MDDTWPRIEPQTILISNNGWDIASWKPDLANIKQLLSRSPYRMSIAFKGVLTVENIHKQTTPNQ